MKSGILIIDKPQGLSTNKLIQEIKQQLKITKIGHAGTLDPLATGVVVVLINNATKISDYLLNADKGYLVTLKLFTSTSTYDLEGDIVEQVEPFLITQAQVEQVVTKYNGYTYEQVPPIYSAIKVNGKKLYQYALEDKEVEIQSRLITIKNLTLINYDQVNGTISLAVECSKGTYVRSLAVDLAQELNTIAHVIELRRTKSGNFTLENSQTLEHLAKAQIIPIKDALQMNEMPIVKISLEQERDVSFGKKIMLLNQTQPLIFISDSQENIVSVYEKETDHLYKCRRGGLNN